MALCRTAALSACGLVLASASTLAVAPSASAACVDYGTYYSVSATSSYIPFKGIPTFKDGRGGEIEVSRSYSGSASYQVTAGAESEVGAVLAKAKVSVSASLTKTNTTSTTHTYRHTITSTKYGHAQYVAWSKKVTWKKYQIYTASGGGCAVRNLASGTINFPTSSEGWRYWETTS